MQGSRIILTFGGTAEVQAENIGQNNEFCKIAGNQQTIFSFLSRPNLQFYRSLSESALEKTTANVLRRFVPVKDGGTAASILCVHSHSAAGPSEASLHRSAITLFEPSNVQENIARHVPWGNILPRVQLYLRAGDTREKPWVTDSFDVGDKMGAMDLTMGDGYSIIGAKGPKWRNWQTRGIQNPVPARA